MKKLAAHGAGAETPGRADQRFKSILQLYAFSRSWCAFSPKDSVTFLITRIP
jgi:hypothetical protein